MDSIEIRILKGDDLVRVTRVQCEKAEVVDEDPAYPLPPLARLTSEEQMFVVAFLRVHGNIREMERLFNISYPTVKKRLNAVVTKLDASFDAPAETRERNEVVSDVLERLARGELKVDDVLATLDDLRRE